MPAILLQLLPVIISLATELTSLVPKIVDALKQSKELTPDEQAQLDAHIAELESQPWWTVND